MSERGSFVTEYIYCPKCLERMRAALLRNEKYLCSSSIPSWLSGDEQLPIIAGKVGGLGRGDEFLEIAFNTFDESNAPCHPVRIAVLSDTAGWKIFKVNPNGNVECVGAGG